MPVVRRPAVTVVVFQFSIGVQKGPRIGVGPWRWTDWTRLIDRLAGVFEG